MDLFNLPDLGEGLPDAEIHEWFVKEGDIVTADQPGVARSSAHNRVQHSDQAFRVVLQGTAVKD